MECADVAAVWYFDASTGKLQIVTLITAQEMYHKKTDQRQLPLEFMPRPAQPCSTALRNAR